MVNIVFGMYRRRVRPATKNDVAQHGGHSPANTKSRFTAYIFDIGVGTWCIFSYCLFF